jgi:tripartite-type tricarboxylate transporter receptor subunit TctC
MYDIFSGRIELGAAVLGAAFPHIRGGKVRALGVTGAKRSDQAPDVPTIAEGGLPGFSFEPFYAIVVAAGTPREIVSALSERIAKGMSAPEFRARFVKTVASPVALSTPDQTTQRARQEAELIERIVRTAGVKLE